MSVHQGPDTCFLARRGLAAGFPVEELIRSFDVAWGVRFAGAAGLRFAGTVLAGRAVVVFDVGLDFGLLRPVVLEGSGWVAAALAARASLRRRLLR